MRRGQAGIASMFAGLGMVTAFWRGLPPIRSAALSVPVYFACLWLFATVGRTRYWLARGSGRSTGRSCPGCGRWIRRLSGDWYLECKRCGWKPGLPIVRWLTHSVPSRQFRRSVSPQSVVVSGIAIVVVVSGVPSVSTAPTGPVDSDGDRLHDAWERDGATKEGYPLPDGDPKRKDLYLLLLVPEGIDPLTRREQSNLASIWSSMPVQNPVGETGVTLHVQQTRLETSLSFDGTNQSFENLRDAYYDTGTIGDGLCVAHVGLLAPMPESEYAGRASAPGYFFIADGTLQRDYGQAYTVRTTAITHELLHNVVGEFENGDMHTEEGWLNGHRDAQHGADFFLSERSSEKLSEEGFAEWENPPAVRC